MTVRIFHKADGSLTIRHLAPKSRLLNETITQWENRLLNKNMPEYVEYEDIDSSELPENIEDRPFWTKEVGGNFSVDVVKRERYNQLRLIENEKKEIVEQQAIDSLKGKGDLPQDYINRRM